MQGEVDTLCDGLQSLQLKRDVEVEQTRGEGPAIYQPPHARRARARPTEVKTSRGATQLAVYARRSVDGRQPNLLEYPDCIKLVAETDNTHIAG